MTYGMRMQLCDKSLCVTELSSESFPCRICKTYRMEALLVQTLLLKRCCMWELKLMAIAHLQHLSHQLAVPTEVEVVVMWELKLMAIAHLQHLSHQLAVPTDVEVVVRRPVRRRRRQDLPRWDANHLCHLHL
jgi:hypothetical protein